MSQELKQCVPIQDDTIPENYKSYLGDGAYVRFDGYGFWITAENGVEVTEEVYLEPSAVESLLRFFSQFLKVTK